MANDDLRFDQGRSNLRTDVCGIVSTDHGSIMWHEADDERIKECICEINFDLQYFR